MSLKILMGVGLLFVMFAPVAEAGRLDDVRERMAERRIAREVARNQEKSEKDEEEQSLENSEPCECKSRIKLAKPSMYFTNDGLMFVPRVDVSVRGKGDLSEKLNVAVNFSGESSYQSEDVAVPGGMSFSGSRQIADNAMCQSSYKYRGLELGRFNLAGLMRSLVGLDQELTGAVRMQAEVVGCDDESEEKVFGFDLEEMGGIDLGGWKRI